MTASTPNSHQLKPQFSIRRVPLPAHHHAFEKIEEPSGDVVVKVNDTTPYRADHSASTTFSGRVRSWLKQNRKKAVITSLVTFIILMVIIGTAAGVASRHDSPSAAGSPESSSEDEGGESENCRSSGQICGTSGDCERMTGDMFSKFVCVADMYYCIAVSDETANGVFQPFSCRGAHGGFAYAADMDEMRLQCVVLDLRLGQRELRTATYITTSLVLEAAWAFAAIAPPTWLRKRRFGTQRILGHKQAAMAKKFGAIAATVSLFHNCIDTFNYAQVARGFGSDYELYQIKLELARTRLNRWGDAVGINYAAPFHRDNGAVNLASVRSAERALSQIQVLFDEFEQMSQRYEKVSPTSTLGHAKPSHWVSSTNKQAHEHLRNIANRRQKAAGFINKSTWALRDSVHFLETIQEAATATDSVLARAARLKMEELYQKNVTGDVSIDEQAKVLVGNSRSDNILGRNGDVIDSSSNSTGNIIAKGSSRLQVGHRFGGPDFFEG
ncbi:Heterokaryon incompatibility protein s [Paramyrothecium foliicola]|nr:Heterokaryon incompatibility protein s [Paramyrothecium foliicola]